MKQKLIIIQNGLKDLVGHYFETAVSVAEAARTAGMHAVLGVHVHCPTSLFPDWLEVYPLFCTDHAMGTPAAEPPDLQDIISDPYGPQVLMESVIAGEVTLRDFLESQLVRPQPPKEEAIKQPRLLAALRRLVVRFVHVCSAVSWLGKRVLHYGTPPLLRLAIQWFVHGVSEYGLPPVLHGEVCRQLLHSVRARLWPQEAPAQFALSDHFPTIANRIHHPSDGPFVREAYELLLSANQAHELEHALLFQRDLERLLGLAGFTNQDHVLLATTHPRELLAVHLVARRLGPACPTFHLEFRHCVFSRRPSYEEFANSPSIWRQRAFLSLYAGWGASSRIRLYTDTELLSEEYASLADLDFGVLPIPFRTHLVPVPANEPSYPLCLSFLGEARDEKNFHWLPGLVQELWQEYVEPGKVRFVIQATHADPRYNPRSAEALPGLRALPAAFVRLVGDHEPLETEEYYRLVSETAIALLPYDRDHYHAGSSGTLAEAIAAGKPAIVPADTWLSRQVAPGAGEAFVDEASFRHCVRKVIDDYTSYHQRASAQKEDWLAIHQPARFVAALLDGESDARPLSEPEQSVRLAS